MNKKTREELEEQLLQNPEKFGGLLNLFKDVIGQENISEMIKANIYDKKRQTEIERKAKMIATPIVALENTNINEMNSLRIILEEFNICYFNKLYTAIALLSRKIIIDVTHALAFVNSEKKEDIEKLKGESFEKYIDWLSENRYLTPNNEEQLRKMKKESNLVHHGQVSNEEISRDSETYFQIIKIFVESNFDTKGEKFVEKTNGQI